MKKLLILVIVIISVSTSASFGQGRHSIKVGFGTNLFWDHDSYNPNKNNHDKYSLGPTLHIDYGYKLNKYLELGANVFSLTNHYGKHSDATKLAALAKFTVAPFPRTFRYVRLGVGIGWMRTKYIFTNPVRNVDYVTRNQFAFDCYIRAYAIDNQRFELYGTYGLTYVYYKHEKKVFWSNSNVSLHFGVKFR